MELTAKCQEDRGVTPMIISEIKKIYIHGI